MTTAIAAPAAAPAPVETDNAGIAPDDALVINLRDLGVAAAGPELETLFLKFCARNRLSPWQFELSPNGEIIAMAPVNYPTGFYETKMVSRLDLWSDDYGGEVTSPSQTYRMPATGGILCPDAAWVSPQRLAANPPVAGAPLPVCPDFVVEIRSTYDNLAPLHAKMRLYIRNGALLGWLIDARNRRVYIYRAGRPEPETVDNPATLSGEEVLPGFTFEVARWIFDRI